MPVIRSAEKKLRQSQSRHERNLVAKQKTKALIDSYKKKPSPKDLPKVYAAIDKLAKIGVIHTNKAARLKSRLALRSSATPAGLKAAGLKRSSSRLVKTGVKSKAKVKPTVAPKVRKVSKKK